MDYKGKRWLHTKAAVLRRDKGICQDALRYGRREPANTVHHVYPAEDFPGWAYERWNLISVTQNTHNSFHDRVTGKLTAKGLAWQRRISPPPSAPPPFGRSTGDGPLFRRRENGGGGSEPGP